MSNGSGVREAVPVSIVGIDLADRKQMVVVCDHDSRVLARRTFRCKAWDLGGALEWAAERAARAGFAGVTVSVSRPGTGGGCWASWLLSGTCRSAPASFGGVEGCPSLPI